MAARRAQGPPHRRFPSGAAASCCLSVCLHRTAEGDPPHATLGPAVFASLGALEDSGDDQANDARAMQRSRAASQPSAKLKSVRAVFFMVVHPFFFVRSRRTVREKLSAPF